MREDAAVRGDTRLCGLGLDLGLVGVLFDLAGLWKSSPLREDAAVRGGTRLCGLGLHLGLIGVLWKSSPLEGLGSTSCLLFAARRGEDLLGLGERLRSTLVDDLDALTRYERGRDSLKSIYIYQI